MATLKQRLHRKNSSGGYDVVHLETSASCVLMSDGTTAEAAINSKATSGHTHNYAGSSSAGGVATNAARLSNTSAIGSATNPVYFNASGVPVKTTYTLGKSVPSDAVFTDTVYTHPTSAGNKHIPAGGSSGQILRWSAAGTAVWGADNNTTYSVVSTTADGLAPKRDGSTTKFLRADGTWAVPPDTNTVYTHPNSGVTAGTYRSVTVNAAGHVTAGSNPTVTVAQGGTGKTTLTSGYFLKGNGTGAVTMRAPIDVLSDIGAAASNHSHNFAGAQINPSVIEMSPPNTSANNGGYIDFHYNQDSGDFTSRIIESAKGLLQVQASQGLKAPDSGWGGAFARNIQAGTTDLTAGSSALTSGTIYFVYE